MAAMSDIEDGQVQVPFDEAFDSSDDESSITSSDSDGPYVSSSDSDGPYVSPRPHPARARTLRRGRAIVGNVVPVLRSPRTANYSTTSIHSWLGTNLLDLDPSYQRGVVWTNVKQRDLVDSLMNNFYVPPVIFSVKQNNDHSETRVCIDGKQRLTSIHRFMNGEIYYKDGTSGKKLYYRRPVDAPRRRKFTLLSPAMRDIFRQKQITCVEYDGVTKVQEREIFQRVQLGIALKPKEKLPAMNGPYSEVVRNLLSEFDAIHGITQLSSWGVSSTEKAAACSTDFQLTTQMVYLISQGCGSPKIVPTNRRLVSFLNRPKIAPNDQDIQVKARDAMVILVRALEDSDLLQGLGKFSPSQFVLVHFFIFVFNKNCTSSFSDRQLRSGVASFLQALPERPTITDYQAAAEYISTHLSSSSSSSSANKRKRAGNGVEDQPSSNKRARTSAVPQSPQSHPTAIKRPTFGTRGDSYVEDRLAVRSTPRRRPSTRSATQRHNQDQPVAGPSKFTGCMED